MESKPRIKVLLVIGVGLAVVGAATWGLRRYLAARKSRIVTVAILDSGLEAKYAKEIEQRLAYNDGEIPGNDKDDDGNGFVDDRLGWDFFFGNSDVTDMSNHGTRVARFVNYQCPDCLILPLRVIRYGRGVRPEDFAAGIRYALSRGARVINISLAINETSRELDQALAEAAARRAVVVTAAGFGVPNPYKPAALSTLYPQADSSVIVVGATEERDTGEIAQNFGPEVDIAVFQLRKGVSGQKKPFFFGSSFAAAEISGYVAQLLIHRPDLDLSGARQMLRQATAPPKAADFARLGFGIFEEELFHQVDEAGPSEMAWRIYRDQPDSPGKVILDLSSRWPIQSAGAVWKCAGAPTQTELALGANPFKKGRARLTLEVPPVGVKDCKILARAQLAGGSSREIEISP